MAKPQTIASGKYQAKVGLIAKSYKLKKELADQFAAACRANGESQAAAITKFMTQYIKDTQ